MATTIPGPPGKTRFLDGLFASPEWIRWFNQLLDGIKAGAGISSINGDTTSAQLIKGSGGVTVATAGGVTTIDTSGATAGVSSINRDTTHDQLLIAGSNVTITDTGSGRHTISSTGAGIVAINGDTTARQNISGAGGITVSTTSGTTTITGGGAIVSINSDTTAAQILSPSTGIAITDNLTGGHQIAIEALYINQPPVVTVNGVLPSYNEVVLVNGSL